MILRKMLQRLYASLTTGPGLNARPHQSRQRIDFLELRNLRGTDPSEVISRLLTPGNRGIEFPAKAKVFNRPNYPESEWSEEQREARNAFDQQSRILGKLRDIAQDATDYYNDHGEHALFLGFPLLSLPPTDDRQGLRSNRILAPLVLVPVSLRVRRGAGSGLVLEGAGDGADLVQPNPGLLAWIEQQTGISTENLFSDETGEEPWREIAEIIALVAKASGLPPDVVFDGNTKLQPVPRTAALPATPALLSSAVLGLFPLVNPGLLRDTKWMIEHEGVLLNPVKAFLSPEALVEPEEASIKETTEREKTRIGATLPLRRAAEELLITNADPCQSEAVAHARRSTALVVHGPPGTGKSQTISNIIGDHLARGERVLFVCDKRTALDVVKYRLDSMGLGVLCGVIHDPQRDRRNLYLGLRDRLENLTQDPPLQDPALELGLVNQRLSDLHGELRGYFDRLHAQGADQQSFHELCGKWLELRKRGGVDLPDAEGLTFELLRLHRTDAEELLRRGLKARWPANPFRDRIGTTPSQWLATNPAQVHASLQAVLQAAAVVDQFQQADLVPLDSDIPLEDQAKARSSLADQLETVIRRNLSELAAKLASDTNWKRWQSELGNLAKESERLNRSLDRELFLQTKGALPAVTECNQRLLALEQWAAAAASWTRIFAFGAKKAALEALHPLALTLSPENVERAREFYLGLKARYLWTDLRDRLLGSATSGIASDDQLLPLRNGLPEILTVLEAAEQPVNRLIQSGTIKGLARLQADAPPFVSILRLSAKRADAVLQLEMALSGTSLFSQAAIRDMSAGWRRNAAASPLCQSFLDFSDTLEEAIRFTDRLNTLPEALRRALALAAVRELSWEDAEPAMQAILIRREIRRRLQEDEALARVDTQRVEAAFSELVQRTQEKNELVRRHILHFWQLRWRDRLLAGTGSRLNSLGAALRQRLFVRGQRAMKLRQMIAAGAGTEGGDPLFDLCPVWMASPATVAQIFPREVLFDVVVFDEASQCRLEEALPVLLRGKRVVIAGDPKQLPPTRFFEQSLSDSDDTAAETAEEVFVQQQSEVEDLLAAALNLNVQEAFLDVHYRSRNEALIGFSNAAFYGSRLQPIPGHPRNKAFQAPIRVVRVDGVYRERGNESEAKAAANLVAELLDDPNPPSIGIACFNLNQRDLILDALEERAAEDRPFAQRLEEARKRQGKDSFEGLFVKNLENVQGDERDHIIISTTFGIDPDGKFRRNFGALSRAGGERRLNVLVTRAREMIHVLTSIPRTEYIHPDSPAEGERPTGRHHLYAYLRYAEQLDQVFEQWQKDIETAKRGAAARCELGNTAQRSTVAEALGRWLYEQHRIGSTVYWGNDGFCVDVALTHPELAADVTLGVLADFTRYLKTPDPIAWEQFRSMILTGQGWKLHRVWTPALFRDPEGHLETIRQRHEEIASTSRRRNSLDSVK